MYSKNVLFSRHLYLSVTFNLSLSGNTISNCVCVCVCYLLDMLYDYEQ